VNAACSTTVDAPAQAEQGAAAVAHVLQVEHPLLTTGSITAGLNTVVAVGAKPTTVRCIGAKPVTHGADGAKLTVCTVAVGANPTVWTTGAGAKPTVCTVGTGANATVCGCTHAVLLTPHRFIRMRSNARPGYQWSRTG
jgi:hypothetical protein